MDIDVLKFGHQLNLFQEENKNEKVTVSDFSPADPEGTEERHQHSASVGGLRLLCLPPGLPGQGTVPAEKEAVRRSRIYV